MWYVANQKNSRLKTTNILPQCSSGSCINGACTTTTCEGRTCGNFANCGPGGDCFCFTGVDGKGFCAPGSTLCLGLPSCTSNADCKLGSVCSVGSCCKRNVCLPTGGCGSGSLQKKRRGMVAEGLLGAMMGKRSGFVNATAGWEGVWVD
jgi:hypothetical protein